MTDLNLSCVLGIKLQSLIPLLIGPSMLQHGLQLLVMAGQLKQQQQHYLVNNQQSNIHVKVTNAIVLVANVP